MVFRCKQAEQKQTEEMNLKEMVCVSISNINASRLRIITVSSLSIDVKFFVQVTNPCFILGVFVQDIHQSKGGAG